ncbi:MAG TPA: ABC transporter substrate-binding protein [Candidatus Limnocylindria bacterium]|nr:ABC transporter substrate-binding protein [Candidatus Limnocylindria bacterium]
MTHRVRASFAILAVLALVIGGCATTGTPSGGGGGDQQAAGKPFVFASTQFTPVEEQERMRQKILAGFTGAQVDFVTEAENASIDRVTAEAKAGGQGQIGLIGYENGQFGALARAGYLSDISKVLDKHKDKKIPADMIELGKLGTSEQLYVPWMQATYFMAINKKALQYLPSGADVNALTYDQLIAWGKNIQDKTGKKMIGLPAGTNSLLHRLLQGFLYPSYTGGLVTTYKSADAVTMWGKIKDLWAVTNPQSTTYAFMQEPLQSEEVWIGFDHVARLINVLKAKPDDFVAVPAPAGPKGRYYMSVVIGLSIPKTTPNRAGAEALIDYLLKPETQITTLRENSFFPVIDVKLPTDLNKGLQLEADAVIKQSAAKDAKVVPLPVGLGAKGGDFNKAIVDTFQRIVIKGENVQTVLNEQAALLQKAVTDANAPCWGPDGKSTGPCQVK